MDNQYDDPRLSRFHFDAHFEADSSQASASSAAAEASADQTAAAATATAEDGRSKKAGGSKKPSASKTSGKKRKQRKADESDTEELQETQIEESRQVRQEEEEDGKKKKKKDKKKKKQDNQPQPQPQPQPPATSTVAAAAVSKQPVREEEDDPTIAFSQSAFRIGNLFVHSAPSQQQQPQPQPQQAASQTKKKKKNSSGGKKPATAFGASTFSTASLRPVKDTYLCEESKIVPMSLLMRASVYGSNTHETRATYFKNFERLINDAKIDYMFIEDMSEEQIESNAYRWQRNDGAQAEAAATNGDGESFPAFTAAQPMDGSAMLDDGDDVNTQMLGGFSQPMFSQRPASAASASAASAVRGASAPSTMQLLSVAGVDLYDCCLLVKHFLSKHELDRIGLEHVPLSGMDVATFRRICHLINADAVAMLNDACVDRLITVLAEETERKRLFILLHRDRYKDAVVRVKPVLRNAGKKKKKNKKQNRKGKQRASDAMSDESQSSSSSSSDDDDDDDEEEEEEKEEKEEEREEEEPVESDDDDDDNDLRPLHVKYDIRYTKSMFEQLPGEVESHVATRFRAILRASESERIALGLDNEAALRAIGQVCSLYLSWYFSTPMQPRLRKRLAWAVYVHESSKKKTKRRACEVLESLENAMRAHRLFPIIWSTRNTVSKAVNAIMDPREGKNHQEWLNRTPLQQRMVDKKVAQVYLDCLLPMDDTKRGADKKSSREKCLEFRLLKVLIIRDLDSLITSVLAGVRYVEDINYRRSRKKNMRARNLQFINSQQQQQQQSASSSDEEGDDDNDDNDDGGERRRGKAAAAAAAGGDDGDNERLQDEQLNFAVETQRLGKHRRRTMLFKRSVQEAFDHITNLLILSGDAQSGTVYSSSFIHARVNNMLKRLGKEEVKANERIWRNLQNNNLRRSKIGAKSRSFVLQFDDADYERAQQQAAALHAQLSAGADAAGVADHADASAAAAAGTTAGSETSSESDGESTDSESESEAEAEPAPKKHKKGHAGK